MIENREQGQNWDNWAQAREFFKEFGIVYSFSAFDPIERLRDAGWTVELDDSGILIMVDNYSDEYLSRAVQFEAVKSNDPDRGEVLKATFSRGQEHVWGGKSSLTVEEVHSIKSEGGFLIAIWGFTKINGIELRQHIEICERDQGIRYRVDEAVEQYSVKPSVYQN